MSMTSAATAAPPYRDRKRHCLAAVGAGAGLHRLGRAAGAVDRRRALGLGCRWSFSTWWCRGWTCCSARTAATRRKRGAGAGGRPLLPQGDLCDGAGAVAQLHRQRVVPGHARAAAARAAGAGRCRPAWPAASASTWATSWATRTRGWNAGWRRSSLAPTGYGHFFIEHNRGHHRDVATPADPASSRMGETIYGFVRREMPGALEARLGRSRSIAWAAAASRCCRCTTRCCSRC